MLISKSIFVKKTAFLRGIPLIVAEIPIICFFFIFFLIICMINPMTMSVLKGRFSFPLTSYAEERKSKHKRSRQREQNRENRMLCKSSTAIQCNIKTRPSNLHTHSTKITYIVHRHVALYNKTVASELLQYVFKTVCFVRGGGIDPRTL